MHRNLAIGVAGAVFLLVFLYGVTRRPWYETNALIYVQPTQSRITTDSSAATYDSTRYDSYIQQQLQTIVRKDILAEALTKPATIGWRFPGESDDAAIARLKDELKVERDVGSYQINISLSGGSPTAIADMVNAVADAYIRGERNDELAQTDQQLKILKVERDRITTSLGNDRQEQASLSAALGVADASADTTNPFDTQLSDLRSQLATASAAHSVAEAQYVSIAAHGSDEAAGLQASAEEAATADPGLISLKQTIMAQRSTLVTQMAGLTPRNPLYQQDEFEIKRLDHFYDKAESEVRTKAATQIQQKLKLDANRTGDLQNRLQGELSEKAALATSATPKLQRSADLVLDITRLQTHFTEIDGAINSIELDKNTSGLVHLLLSAVAPSKPKASKKNLILGSAIPLAILLGLGVAVLRQKLDPKVYIAEDVGRTLEFKPMAVLPHPNDVKSSVVDEFMLRLVAGVDQAHRTGGARTFIFTAASAGTKVTEMVVSLSRKMERFGYTTMVVDAAEILKHVALPKEEMAYLLGEGPSGGSSSGRAPAKRRDSYTIGNFSRMRQSVDLVFIEGLPLLSSAETEFAARLSDITILIAESNRTTRAELTNSLGLLKRLNVPGVAAVLDNVSSHFADDDFLAVVSGVEARLAKSKPLEPEPVDYATKRSRVVTHDDQEVYSGD